MPVRRASTAGTLRGDAGTRLIRWGRPREGIARLAGLERGEGEELMVHAVNGMPASGLPGAVWRKSNYSNPNGNCVEVAELAGGTIAVRNSHHPGGPALIYTPAAIAAFIRGVKDGQFDYLIHLCPDLLRTAHTDIGVAYFDLAAGPL